MMPSPLTPAPSCEPSGGPHTERIFKAALVIDPEAIEGRLMAEAPPAKRQCHSGGFSLENEDFVGSLDGLHNACGSPTH